MEAWRIKFQLEIFIDVAAKLKFHGRGRENFKILGY